MHTYTPVESAYVLKSVCRRLHCKRTRDTFPLNSIQLTCIHSKAVVFYISFSLYFFLQKNIYLFIYYSKDVWAVLLLYIEFKNILNAIVLLYVFDIQRYMHRTEKIILSLSDSQKECHFRSIVM